MHIFLILLAWTIVSIAYTISRLGYKNSPRGFRKYAEWFICPPVLIIAYVIGGIRWFIKKPDVPCVDDGNNTWVNLQIPNHESKKILYTNTVYWREGY